MTLPDLSALGLETTGEERANWHAWANQNSINSLCFGPRSSRDIDCLVTALSEARANATRREAMIKAERDEWDSREAAAREEEREALLTIIRGQPYYPDTNVGMRQQWVKDQIEAKVRARSTPTDTGGNDSDRSRHFPMKD